MRFSDLLLNPKGRQVVAPRSMSARQFVSYMRYRLGKTSRFFIHIPKNAGSSIGKNKTLRKDVVFADPRFLKDQAYWQSFYDYMTQIGAHYGPHHARLVDWPRTCAIPTRVLLSFETRGRVLCRAILIISSLVAI